MSVLRRLLTKMARFAKALEGIDDPIGQYMFSLGKRVENLERAVEHLERRPPSRADGGRQRSTAQTTFHAD